MIEMISLLFFICDRHWLHLNHLWEYHPIVTGETHDMDMRNSSKNWSKHVFGCRLIPPLAYKSVDNLQWDYMKGFSVDEDRACYTWQRRRADGPYQRVCVCPLSLCGRQLHHGIRGFTALSQQSLTDTNQHGGCTKSERFTGSPGMGSFPSTRFAMNKYLQIVCFFFSCWRRHVIFCKKRSLRSKFKLL